ncbi:hypothetical protein MHC_04980 [Mycoplasma haemocanis str. Illinois]|uniref:Uncharacterized protein n=1 Tax=Mycoplasma haemocanis (strain Illinois) TaxID=1111676 RepID=H6N880_MYCHN|nr:hypothetical protein [Mycoplasma haemocanis]AEW45852.1 hypothetical protein MHC_04980 [Mycoplasma haemocanis str. Illinois]
MSSSFLTKSVLATGAVGGVTGGAYLAKPHIFPEKEKIEARLKKDKWESLNFEGQDEKWKEIYNVYKEKELTDPSRFDQKIAKGEDESTGLSKLKNNCREALTKDFRESLYRTVTKWCVVPVGAADRLVALGGYQKINVNDNDTTTDKDAWTSKESSFKTNLTSNNTYLGVSLPDNTNTSEDNIKLLKQGCKKHMEKKNYEIDFEGSMNKVQKWCGK